MSTAFCLEHLLPICEVQALIMWRGRNSLHPWTGMGGATLSTDAGIWYVHLFWQKVPAIAVLSPCPSPDRWINSCQCKAGLAEALKKSVFPSCMLMQPWRCWESHQTLISGARGIQKIAVSSSEKMVCVQSRATGGAQQTVTRISEIGLWLQEKRQEKY